MLLDLTKFLSVLERIATALENNGGTGTPEVVGEAKRPRGRPPKSEAATSTPEQLAAAAAGAQSASAAVVTTAQTAPAATNAGSPDQAEKPVITQPTLQQVADAIIDLANNHSRDKAVEILSKFGVKKVPELKPETFKQVLDAVAAAKAPSAASGLI